MVDVIRIFNLVDLVFDLAPAAARAVGVASARVSSVLQSNYTASANRTIALGENSIAMDSCIMVVYEQGVGKCVVQFFNSMSAAAAYTSNWRITSRIMFGFSQGSYEFTEIARAGPPFAWNTIRAAAFICLGVINCDNCREKLATASSITPCSGRRLDGESCSRCCGSPQLPDSTTWRTFTGVTDASQGSPGKTWILARDEDERHPVPQPPKTARSPSGETSTDRTTKAQLASCKVTVAKMGSGESMDLLLCGSNTICDVKTRIKEKWEYPVYSQALVFGTGPISDDVALGSLPDYAEGLHFTLLLDQEQALLGALGLSSLAA